MPGAYPSSFSPDFGSNPVWRFGRTSYMLLAADDGLLAAASALRDDEAGVVRQLLLGAMILDFALVAPQILSMRREALDGVLLESMLASPSVARFEWVLELLLRRPGAQPRTHHEWLVQRKAEDILAEKLATVDPAALDGHVREAASTLRTKCEDELRAEREAFVVNADGFDFEPAESALLVQLRRLVP